MPADALIRKLELSVVLTEGEQRAIRDLPFQERNVPADQTVVADGDRPTQCLMIVEGFACRFKIVGDGNRQIFSFHIPGDMPDLQSLHLKVMDHSFGTLTPSRLASLHHDPLRAFLRAYPKITEALWRDTLIDAAIFREWMANVGQREGIARIAHLLCELYVRLKAIGRTTDHRYELPVTQQEIGDATGMSTVHANRVLQDLRAQGMIRTDRRTLVILDWARLQEIADFEPTYLHVSASS